MEGPAPSTGDRFANHRSTRLERLSAIRPRLVSFARMHLRNNAMAEDAVQEALMAAIEKDATFAGRSGYDTWVFGILKYKILDIMRYQKRQGHLQPLDDEGDDEVIDRQFRKNGRWEAHSRPANWGDPDAVVESQHFWRVFDACMIALPENAARVFSLRELMGLSTEEICRLLEIRENNCWVILHRARLRLRQCIEKGWLEGETS
ncbi:MAG: sigma-70 family RNA polymerase sigma factor [Halomonas sp.]|uniref:sigma-70 family RNA polymerase sigma factor n=1 Tax=Halomonas sp. TaxID=1486246 RepID=UPI0018185B08|nr:sigma-70 family RNA polymerase sigma factor [Halomonas sp.]NWN82263.1 sigma-70 family RNA polymerase sigma factor [Halomonas sp.]